MKGVAIFLLIFFTFAAEAMARPTHRFDYTTQTCRSFADGQLEWDSRPWGEGGKVFREVCKQCHFRGNTVGAKFLYEESKTSKGWNNLFAKKHVRCAKNGAWKKMTTTQELKLNDYLYRFASGSGDIWDEV